MSIKQYRFVSPGIFINEVDNSQLPAAGPRIGPVVIGRSERGPSMRPLQVESYSEFVETFGNAVPGGSGGDVWRDGNRTSPMYAGYAAQAYLANQTPLTFIRLLGYNNPDRVANAVEAGWNSAVAYGLFIAPTDGVSGTDPTDAALAAIIYADTLADGTAGDLEVGLIGPDPSQDFSGTAPFTYNTPTTSAWVASQGTDYEFVVQIGDSKFPINFARTSKKFIRRVLNTNPTLTNSSIVDENSDSFKRYWLGETFESHLENLLGGEGSGAAGQAVAMLVPLDDGLGAAASFDKANLKVEAQPPVTSWVFSQHLESYENFTYNTNSLEMLGTKKLFRFSGLNDGEWSSKTLKVGFADITPSENEFNPYGSFTVIIRVTDDSDNAPEYVERYTNCNLNPASLDYIGRKIGDMDSVWDYSETRYRMSGQHPNRSRFVRVEIDQEVDAGTTDAELLPFGFYGPASPRPVLVKADQSSTQDATNASGDLGNASTPLDASTSVGINSEIADTVPGGNLYPFTGVANAEFRLVWPAMSCRTASTVGNLSNGRRSYFGVTSNQQSNGVKADPSYLDFTRPYSAGLSDGSGVVDEVFPQLKSAGAFAGDTFAQLVDATLTVQEGGDVPTTNIADNSGGAALTSIGNDDTVEVSIGTAVPFSETFTFKTTGTPSAPQVDLTGLIGSEALDGLQALADVINATDFGTGNGVGGDVLASVEQSADALVLCLKGLSPEACESLTVQATAAVGSTFGELGDDAGGPSSPLLTAPAATNTCSAGQVRSAAGDFFDNGVVPYFSLDDLVMQDVDIGSGVTVKSRQHVDWLPGARYAGASVTVRGTDQNTYDAIPCGPAGAGDKPGTYRDILEFGYDQFTLPLVGGFDGLDITEKNPFRNSLIDQANELNHYVFNSIKRGIDTVSDPEVVEMNLASVPGITNPALTTHLIEVCKDRGDALGIIDLENDYIPAAEGLSPERDRLPDPELAILELKDRRINNSYGTAYYPWVQARDSINNSVLWVPPSVVALGTMAYSETRPGSAVWFAPAGFNRGGLTDGAAGIPVTNVRYRLTSKERDKLYEANINPIASFPSEGIVVFGNKTLQVTESALDRVNVRRLMIFLKKEVSRIAATILFDQNVQTTWNNFKSQVDSFLGSVQNKFGLTEFKVVLDETTTTPDLIDRNILYAKIFLKPARAIEFIAIDFNITRTGASFVD
jgi:hypothetical protein